jgi:hypothetical protein
MISDANNVSNKMISGHSQRESCEFLRWSTNDYRRNDRIERLFDDIFFFHLLLYFDEKDEFKILMLTVGTEIALIMHGH